MQSTCTSLILTNQLKSGIIISERCRVCWVLLETDGWNMEQCYTYCVVMFRSTTRVTAYHVENLISAKNFGEGGKSCTSLDDDETWINTKSEYDAKWKPAECGGGFLFTCTNCCFYSLVFSFLLRNHLVTNSSISILLFPDDLFPSSCRVQAPCGRLHCKAHKSEYDYCIQTSIILIRKASWLQWREHFCSEISRNWSCKSATFSYDLWRPASPSKQELYLDRFTELYECKSICIHGVVYL